MAADLFKTERADLGVIRVEQNADGIALWVGGRLRWASYGEPQPPLPSPDHVAVIATREEWEEWSSLLSDMLCWCRGFNAALGSDDAERQPFGVEGVRRVRLAILSAIRKAGSHV